MYGQARDNDILPPFKVKNANDNGDGRTWSTSESIQSPDNAQLPGIHRWYIHICWLSFCFPFLFSFFFLIHTHLTKKWKENCGRLSKWIFKISFDEWLR